VLLTSEQVVKNYLRTAFDKLGVWTRLELALYVAGHGGANWHMPTGNGLLPPGGRVERSRGRATSVSGSSGIGSGISSTISSPVKEKPSASRGQL